MNDTTENPVYELMRAVDTLTQEHDQIVDDRHGRFLGTRREKPLLLKLRGLVASNLGAGGGVGAAAQTRVPINVGARDLLDEISTEIIEWYGRETDYSEHGRPTMEVTLRQWYIRYANRVRSGEVADRSVWERVGEVRGWITRIRDQMDPPYRWPLTAPCPICGQEWVTLYTADDPNEIERIRVLNAVEREKADDSYVICRNPECGRIWRGAMENRALNTLIDEARHKRESSVGA